MEAVSVMNEIKRVAGENARKAQKVHHVGSEIKCFRQGDVYIFRVPSDWPVGDAVKRDQIVDGVSLGSRHVLKGKFEVYRGVKLPDCINNTNKRACMGYAFDAVQGCELIHPEHDHYVFADGGRFQVLHQIDMRTLKRVAD